MTPTLGATVHHKSFGPCRVIAINRAAGKVLVHLRSGHRVWVEACKLEG